MTDPTRQHDAQLARIDAQLERLTELTAELRNKQRSPAARPPANYESQYQQWLTKRGVPSNSPLRKVPK